MKSGEYLVRSPNCPLAPQNTQPYPVFGLGNLILPQNPDSKYDSGLQFHSGMVMQHIDAAHAGDPKKQKQASIVVVDPSPLSLIATAGVLDYQGYGCVCARTGDAAIQALEMGQQDLVVWDVGDDAAAALGTLLQMREKKHYEDLPAVLIADSQWAGLEKKAEAMTQATRCLFKPIDPNSLIAVVHQVLYMPTLVKAHRKKGTRPSRPGWVTL